jgi:putative tryptophan/tyrosine transport system substrate-binding protein
VLLAARLPVAAQPGKVWRIGLLTSADVDAGHPGIAAFRERLRELGYVEGRNVALDIRSTEKAEGFAELAADLVRLGVDVIVAVSSASIAPAQQATRSIPIVMVIAADPVASGFVASLARPGGNITGLTTQSSEVAGKRLALVKTAIPGLASVTVVWEAPGGPPTERMLSEVRAAAASLRIQVEAAELRRAGDLDAVIAAAVRKRTGAAIMAGPLAYAHRHSIARLGITHRLPLVGTSADYAEAGWLMGYGPSYTDQNRRAADFVDRILKGARPAELPVEQPTKYYLSVNRRTATAIGVAMPQQFLQVADQVID